MYHFFLGSIRNPSERAGQGLIFQTMRRIPTNFFQRRLIQHNIHQGRLVHTFNYQREGSSKFWLGLGVASSILALV